MRLPVYWCVMNSVLTSSVINRGLDCSIGGVMNSADMECDKSWVRLPVYR